MEWRIEQRDDQKPYGKGALVLTNCPGGECRFSLWAGAPLEHGATHMWQWNGDIVRPTINPSVNCQGGCNRHFTMTGGVPSPDTP